MLGFKGASTSRSICAPWPVESGTFCYLYYFSEVSFGSTLAWVPLPKRNPKNRLLDPPVCIITFYNIQPSNVNHNIHIPRLHLPTAHLRNRPEMFRPRPKANSPAPCRRSLPECGAFHCHPTPHFSPGLPFSGSAGSRRSRFIQQSAVRSGPAQHARPSHATGRLGADPPNNRNATVAPRGGRETFIIDRVYRPRKARPVHGLAGNRVPGRRRLPSHTAVDW